MSSAGLPRQTLPASLPGVQGTPPKALLDSALDTDAESLRMLLRISQAVMGARFLDEALEVVAEQTLLVLGATSFSISRWERQTGALRTLINVGELGPAEVRWPGDELYPLAEDDLVADLLRQGRPYIISIDDHAADSAAVAVLRSLGKECELAVPVMYDGATWGELWATGTRGRRFGEQDVRLLQWIAAQMSVAIGTAEAFSEVSRCAYEDPLTGLANRRALDDRLLACFADGGGPTVVVADVDGLKTVNDRDGHPAGDALLRGVAGVLSSVASTVPGALVARLGGDEFCLMLPRSPLSDAQRLACEAARQISAELGGEVSLCWGAATRDGRTATAHELIAAADAVLLEAKRLGPGRLRIRLDDNHVRPHAFSGPATSHRATPGRRRPDRPCRRHVCRQATTFNPVRAGDAGR